MTRFIILLNVLLLLNILLLSSCGSKSIYDEQVSIEQARWFKGESAKFTVDIKDSTSIYDFYMNIRNTTQYRYSNLYVFLLTRFPNGNLSRDTIECQLADKTGKWLGKGWGSVKENNIILKRGLRFPLKGEYVFMVQQAMRIDTLEGITDVGIKIVRLD